MNERPDSICPAWRTELLGVFQTAGFLNTNLAGIFARDLEARGSEVGTGAGHGDAAPPGNAKKPRRLSASGAKVGARCFEPARGQIKGAHGPYHGSPGRCQPSP